MNSISQFSKSEDICSIAVGKTQGNKTHCGILYDQNLNDEKVSYFLHLGSPMNLHNDREEDTPEFKGYKSQFPNFLWTTFKDVPTEIMALLRTKCIAITNKNEALPYGIFHDEETSFDAVGNLVLGSEASGLTCATFVKTVLKGCGIDVIDDAGWPEDRDGDIVWLDAMIKIYEEKIEEWIEIRNQINKNLKYHRKDSALLESRKKIVNYINSFNKAIEDFKEGKESFFKRYRPEEVSACSYCSMEDMPIPFEYEEGMDRGGACVLGAELFEILPLSIQPAVE